MTILKNVAELLTKHGIHSEATRKRLLVPIRGGRCGTQIIVTEHGSNVTLRVSIPLYAPDLKLEDVRRGISLLNGKIQNSAFVVAEDGEVCFRARVAIQGKDGEEGQIVEAIFDAWWTVAMHSTALVEIALGEREPNTVLESASTLPLNIRDAQEQ